MRRRSFVVPIFAAMALAVLPPGAFSRSVASPALTKVVRTGSGPCGTTMAGDGLWVGVYGAGTLLRL